MKKFLGREIPETLQEIIDPRNTIVLVQDSQNDFLHKDGYLRKQGLAQDASRLYGPMNVLLKEARNRRIRVLYSSFTNYADLSNYNNPQITRGSKQMLEPEKQWVVDGAWGWQVIDEVKPQAGERIVKKLRNDAFVGTELDLILKSMGATSIIHIGISIPNGILTTAWHAFNLGYYPVIPQDAAGAAIQSDEAEGWKLLKRCATITTTDEIIKAWKSSR